MNNRDTQQAEGDRRPAAPPFSDLKRVAGRALRFGEGVLNAVLPPRCLLSGEIVDRPGQIAPAYWKDIHFIEKPVCVSCGVPLAFDAGDEARCTACLVRPPAYDRARSAFVYDETSRHLVLAFKHGHRRDGVAAFARWMARAGEEALAEAQGLVPVPLHYRRLVWRRFNPSALLAQRLEAVSGVPVVVDLLKRCRATPRQKGKSPAERRRNVAGAFSVRAQRRALVKGARLVLVDDVLTTGATVEACARALKRAGAERVTVVTLARVVAEERLPV